MRKNGLLDRRRGLLMNRKMRVDDVKMLRLLDDLFKSRTNEFTKSMKTPVLEVVWSTLLNYCSELRDLAETSPDARALPLKIQECPG